MLRLASLCLVILAAIVVIRSGSAVWTEAEVNAGANPKVPTTQSTVTFRCEAETPVRVVA
jgi:hypothetical protein